MSADSEVWRPVVGWEGVYKVSDLGCVRSLDRVVVESNGRRTRRIRGVMLSLRRSGLYASVALTLGQRGRSRTRRVHSLVAEAFIGPRPAGREVRHRNGQHRDNRVANLTYGTSSENKLDTVAHKTHREARKIVDKWGHLLESPNLHEPALPQRKCRACYLTGRPAQVARQRGHAFDRRAEADRRYREIMESAA